MRREWLVVHNPRARAGACRFAGMRAELEARAPCDDLRHISLGQLADLEADPDRIIVIGGDGTVNGTVEWLVRRDRRCPVAIIAGGTGNNLAAGLGIPRDPEAALEVAVSGARVRSLDVVSYRVAPEDRPRVILQSGALGFPAQVASRYDRLRRRPLWRALLRPLGGGVYTLLAFLGLLAQKRRERRGENLLEIEVRFPAGTSWREKAIALFIGNERSLGGGFVPCPEARVDDGKMDLCLVRAGTGASYVRTFRQVRRGEHLDRTETVLYEQSAGPVEILLSHPQPLLSDGDLWIEGRSFRLDLLAGALEVVVA